MRVGIITFHASHNYGSVLQAYALQQTVMSLGHECEIINFRTQRQIDLYKPFYCQNRFRAKLKALLYPILAVAVRGKYEKFESFINEKYVMSASQYATVDELSQTAFDYDAVICGSDQIWNTNCYDFDEAYLLTFINNVRKIAYAPSMGPRAALALIPNKQELFNNIIPQFDFISVRENASKEVIEKICGLTADVVVDPTLLLNSEYWNQLSGTKPLVAGDYIFFYSPWDNIEVYDEAIKIASEMHTKLVISLPYWYPKFHRNPNVVYFVNSGPLEFLNLVKYSRMVIGASFHAVAFSIIYGKQFYAVDGMNDNRVSNLLRPLSIECFAKSPDLFMTDQELTSIYNDVRIKLTDITNKSRAYLEKALS